MMVVSLKLDFKMTNQFKKQNITLSQKNSQDRILWAKNEYQDQLIMSTSFGIQSAVMLHLVIKIIPNIPIIFIDTGYLFPETYLFAKELKHRLNLNLKTYKAKLSSAEQEQQYGKLWEQGISGLDKYNKMNKIEPMNRAIKELKATAWIAGLRRDQSTTRKNLSVIEKQNNIIKIYPIIDWSDYDIDKYLSENNLPYHPLWKKGYVSIGDWHSSSPLQPNMKPEDTRFHGMKRECGLHINFDQGAGI